MMRQVHIAGDSFVDHRKQRRRSGDGRTGRGGLSVAVFGASNYHAEATRTQLPDGIASNVRALAFSAVCRGGGARSSKSAVTIPCRYSQASSDVRQLRDSLRHDDLPRTSLPRDRRNEGVHRAA
jgi:hypothetical protein